MWRLHVLLIKALQCLLIIPTYLKNSFLGPQSGRAPSSVSETLCLSWIMGLIRHRDYILDQCHQGVLLRVCKSVCTRDRRLAALHSSGSRCAPSFAELWTHTWKKTERCGKTSLESRPEYDPASLGSIHPPYPARETWLAHVSWL